MSSKTLTIIVIIQLLLLSMLSGVFAMAHHIGVACVLAVIALMTMLLFWSPSRRGLRTILLFWAQHQRQYQSIHCVVCYASDDQPQVDAALKSLAVFFNGHILRYNLTESQSLPDWPPIYDAIFLCLGLSRSPWLAQQHLVQSFIRRYQVSPCALHILVLPEAGLQSTIKVPWPMMFRVPDQSSGLSLHAIILYWQQQASASLLHILRGMNFGEVRHLFYSYYRWLAHLQSAQHFLDKCGALQGVVWRSYADLYYGPG